MPISQTFFIDCKIDFEKNQLEVFYKLNKELVLPFKTKFQVYSLLPHFIGEIFN